MTRWRRRRGGRSWCWGTWPGPRRARGPPPGPCRAPGAPRGPAAPTMWWWCTAAGPPSPAPAEAASRYGPGDPARRVPTGKGLPRSSLPLLHAWVLGPCLTPRHRCSALEESKSQRCMMVLVLGVAAPVACPEGVGHRVPSCPGSDHSPLSPALPHGAPAVSLTCTAWHGPATLLEPGSPLVVSTESWETARCQDDHKGCLLVPCHPSKHVSSCWPCFFHKTDGAPFAGSCHINLCSCVVLKALQSVFI